MRSVSIATVTAALMCGIGAASFAASTADIAGTWLTEGGASKMKLEPCGSVMCGRLVWLREPLDPKTKSAVTDKMNPDPALRSRPLLGAVIIRGIKPGDDPGSWDAQAYNAEDGKTYEVTLKLDSAGRLELEGCGLAGLICQGETWTRATN